MDRIPVTFKSPCFHCENVKFHRDGCPVGPLEEAISRHPAALLTPTPVVGLPELPEGVSEALAWYDTKASDNIRSEMFGMRLAKAYRELRSRLASLPTAPREWDVDLEKVISLLGNTCSRSTRYSTGKPEDYMEFYKQHIDRAVEILRRLHSQATATEAK